MDRVHALYAATVWRDGNENESDSPVLSGLGFVIKKIVVHTEATRVRESELHYNMEKPTWDVRTLLEVTYNICHVILKLIYISCLRRFSAENIVTKTTASLTCSLILSSRVVF